jgi:hypothetical protein
MKRKALESLDPNVPSKRPIITRAKPIEAPLISSPPIQSETRLEPSIYRLSPPESRPEAPPPPDVQPAGFLPANQWKLVQDFHTALDGVKMEYCLRCTRAEAEHTQGRGAGQSTLDVRSPRLNCRPIDMRENAGGFQAPQ